MVLLAERSRIEAIWTQSRQAVVLAGAPITMARIATSLEVDPREIVEASPGLSVLALWGVKLASYHQLVAGSVTDGQLPGGVTVYQA